MHRLTALTLLATFTVPILAGATPAEMAHNPANTISHEADHPDSFRHFVPQLPATRARVAEIKTDFGLHVSEIEPGLHFVTDMIYQSALVVTENGVAVLDAPPNLTDELRVIGADRGAVVQSVQSSTQRPFGATSARGMRFSHRVDERTIAVYEILEQPFPLRSAVR